MKISSKLLLGFCFVNLLIIISSALVYHQLGGSKASQRCLAGPSPAHHCNPGRAKPEKP